MSPQGYTQAQWQQLERLIGVEAAQAFLDTSDVLSVTDLTPHNLPFNTQQEDLRGWSTDARQSQYMSLARSPQGSHGVAYAVMNTNNVLGITVWISESGEIRFGLQLERPAAKNPRSRKLDIRLHLELVYSYPLWGDYMHGTPDSKKRVVHRLKIAKGHLSKVITMVEDDTYCIDIIHQSQAIQKALKEVDNLLLENHLKTCVVEQLKNGETETSIAEVMKVFRKTTGDKK